MEAVGDVPASAGGASVDESSKPSGVSYDTYQRILKEKKTVAEQKAELEAKLRAMEEDTMVKNNQFRELAELEKKRAEEAVAKVKFYEEEKKKEKIKSAIISKLSSYGLKADVQDEVFDIFSRKNYRVQIDPDAGIVIGAEEAAKDFYNEYSNKIEGLFTKKQAGVSHAAPQMNAVNEADAYAAELRACKTQAQLDAVRAKYKRI